MTIRAAGILYTTSSRLALFLQRSAESDMPGTWGLPGGKLEEGEDAHAAAIREAQEEAGEDAPTEGLRLHTRSITLAASPGAPGDASSTAAALPGPVEDVDFTTFVCEIDEPFQVTIDEEHTGWAWAPLDRPPLPMHPGVMIAIERLSMNELGVARAMAAGRLTSPQRYANVVLWAIRLTGTGVAYRSGLKEFVFRDPDNYLNEEFLARCNGLSAIMEHPKKAVLNSKEFADRVIGSVFLPFIPAPGAIPQAKPGDVWAIIKVYDDDANEMMMTMDMSTSPSVVFHDPSVNTKMTMEDGSPLLVEGVPSLLDHIAICPMGVWDKAGEPTGVVNEEVIEATLEYADSVVVEAPRQGLDMSKLNRVYQAAVILDVQMSNRLAR